MEDLINQLPDDCLEHIFSFLPIEERLNVERVCKRWHNIGEKGWPDIRKIDFKSWMSDNLIHSILIRCGRFLIELDISLSLKHPHCLSMVIQFCELKQLEKIGIHRVRASTILKRIGIYLDYASTKKQRELEMCYLRKIFEEAKNLVDLTINENLQMYKIDYLNLVDPTILRKLNIMNYGKRVSFNLDRFPNLKYLYLTRFNIDEGEMKREKESLKALEEIYIRRCRSSRGFIERIQNFTNLQKLDLTSHLRDIRNNDIIEIADHCDKIKIMFVVGAYSLTSECFQYLGKMPKLEILNLWRWMILNSSDMVYLTNVKELNFYACPNMPIDDGLIQLITSSSNLEKLQLVGIYHLDRHFVNDLRQIFHLGLRQKHLHVTALIDYNEFLDGGYPLVINESLLSLEATVSHRILDYV